MSSAEAASWLITTHPTSEGLRLLRHRSWLRADQDCLANHYLRDMPFAAGWPYEALLSAMSLNRFLRFAETHFPSEKAEADLALYYLAPALKAAAKTEADAISATAFLSLRGAA